MWRYISALLLSSLLLMWTEVATATPARSAVEPAELAPADSGAVATAPVDSAATRPMPSRRRISPVTTAATTTQAVNELAGDTAVINAARRARSTHYHDEQGRAVYVDTITGDKWVDSLSMPKVVKMDFGLWHSVAFGVDLWDPLMRAFGQKYGLAGVMAQVNLHNRYLPTFEAGLGMAKSTPSGLNYTYHSPLSPYFKIGCDYNFLYNSNPDYLFMAGLRYGFSALSFSVTDITVDSPYWQETGHPSIPSQKATAGWVEFALGLRVKIAGPISAGWMIKYHGLVHQSKPEYGQPWYIPGYGSRGSTLSASIMLTYTLPINNKRRSAKTADAATVEPDLLTSPPTTILTDE